MLQIGACAGGAYGGAKLGEVIAKSEAVRLKLSPAEAQKRQRAFQIGLGLALCGGGAFIAGSAYSKLSKRGQEAREKEVLAALEDAQPHTYADPDNPALTGTVAAQPTFVQGNEECRIVQDRLATDEAFVKYCRAPGGMWAVKSV
jgi:surface antigen